MQYFTASDGVSVGYSDRGAGRPLVLLHGLMAHSGFFRMQRPLAEEFRLVAMDFRGHGASAAKGEGATLQRLADDVAGLADALDLRGAIGIGWSLGASVIWRVLTGPQRNRFAGSVSIDMTPRVRNDEDWELGLSTELCNARTEAIRDDYVNFAVAAGHAIFAPPLEDGKRELADWASFEFARNDSAAIDAVWTSLAEQDFRGDLPLIPQPALIIRGAHSQLYGSGTASYLSAALPNAELVQFERSGHAPHLEEAEKFNRLIRDFAARLPAAAEASTTA